MAYEKKPGEFTLFANDYKQNDKHPDYKGHGLALDGTALDIALWKRTSQNGKEYYSVKIEFPRPSATSRGEYQRPAYTSAAQVPDRAAAARLAAAEEALGDSLDPHDDDLPF